MNPLRCRTLAAVALLLALGSPCAAQHDGHRPVVGLALAGGSAKGFAHVGVIRWLEDHRIPIDRIAGTSIGGLVAGAYAAGLSAGELDSLIVGTDWDELFGNSTYSYKDIARKEDERAYPSQLEFHLRGGLSLPPSLNRGQQVELLLQRIAGLYGDVSFDSLPTPFRSTAVDLRSGELVVLASGSLPTAMRATMSIPGIFPPVRLGDRILVDGGALNNLPADVARAMGADVVIAVKLGPPEDEEGGASDLLSITDRTVEAMMRASTARAAARADHVVHAAASFGGMDWRKARAIIDDGYRSAEAMKDVLLPYAVDEASWRTYLGERAARRRRPPPIIDRVEVRGVFPEDERAIQHSLEPHAGRPLDLPELEHDLTRLGGLDRYLSFGWSIVREGFASVLVIDAHPLTTAPPFLMASVNVRGRGGDEYPFQLALRMLRYDVLLPRSQLRVDLALGSDRGAGVELRGAIGGGLFAALSAAARADRFDLWLDDELTTEYREERALGQLDLGFTPARDAELRIGLQGGWYDADRKVGPALMPEGSGWGGEVRFHGVYDAQNSAVVPSRGLRVEGWARQVLGAPFDEAARVAGLEGRPTQAELTFSHFWSSRSATDRIFLAGAGGTSFGDEPLVSEQFALGQPLRLDALAPGQRRGADYVVVTVGWLHALGRLPQFFGGPLLGGFWVENGSPFGGLSGSDYEAQIDAALIAETLVGPVWLGVAAGSSGPQLFAGIGRLFF